MLSGAIWVIILLDTCKKRGVRLMLNPIDIFLYISVVFYTGSAIYYIVFDIYRAYRFRQCREKTICKEENCNIRKYCPKSRMSDRERAEIKALIASLPSREAELNEKSARKTHHEISKKLLKFKKKH